MKNKKFFLIGLITLLVVAMVPSNTVALYSGSFDQEVTDYFFLTTVTRNNSTSGITGFPVPDVDSNWMIEVTSLTDGPPVDNLSGKVYEDSGEGLDKWQPTAWFGSGEIAFGEYSNTTGYTIAPSFESMFPIPFILPTNQTAAYNYTLNDSLLVNFNFDYYQWMNLTGMIPPEMADMIPFELSGMVVAYNGTSIWFNATEDRYDPYGNVTGNILLVALYFGDGELNYIRESWWDNSSGRWRTMYQMVSPNWELFGGMFEPMMPGSDASGGGEMISGFPYALVFVGLMVTIAIVYLRKPKNEIVI